MMTPIADTLASRQIATTPLFRSERDELIQTFTDRLNAARKGTKWKPLTCRAVAIRLSHLSVTDMRDFYRECQRAKSFSAYFWWALRPQRVVKCPEKP